MWVDTGRRTRPSAREYVNLNVVTSNHFGVSTPKNKLGLVNGEHCVEAAQAYAGVYQRQRDPVMQKKK